MFWTYGDDPEISTYGLCILYGWRSMLKTKVSNELPWPFRVAD